MTFTVEDGTGIIDANAYATIAEADAYFTERGIADWTGTNTVKEQALVRATDYIETVNSCKFKGQPEFPETPQALSFPRSYLYNKYGKLIEGIPTNLKKATFEYALRSLSAELLPDPEIDDTGLRVNKKYEKVGPIEEETGFQSEGSAPMLLRPYPSADKLLKEYLLATGRAYR